MPGWGVKSKPGESASGIHLAGRQMSGSSQYFGCVWTARRAGETPVWGGIVMVRSAMRRDWGCELLHFGRDIMGG